MLVQWAALCMSCSKHLWGPGRVRREGSMWYALKKRTVIRCIKKLKKWSTDKPVPAISCCWMFDFGTVLMVSSNFMSIIISLFPFLVIAHGFLGYLVGHLGSSIARLKTVTVGKPEISNRERQWWVLGNGDVHIHIWLLRREINKEHSQNAPLSLEFLGYLPSSHLSKRGYPSQNGCVL